MTWRDRAPCVGTPIDWWFPVGAGDAPDPRALALCRGCPVREDCLLEGMALPSIRDDLGVWGGLTASQRNRLHTRVRQYA